MNCLAVKLRLAMCAGLMVLGIESRALAGEVYDQVTPATVLLYGETTDAAKGLIEQSVGSGVLVDTSKKLVVTTEHAVRRTIHDGSFKSAVMFPIIGKDGKIETQAVVYRKKGQTLAIPADIIYFDRAKDLALLRLERVPEGAKALPLADGGARPGDAVHVVGNSTFLDGGAFAYGRGTVRNLFYLNTTHGTSAGFPRRDRFFYNLCHDAPTAPGDSGGPVVNDQKQLLAVVSENIAAGQKGGQAPGRSIHVREIRRALEGMQQPGGNTLEINAAVDRLGFDSFFVPVKKGGRLRAVLKGRGTTDLDLFCKNPDKEFAALIEEVGPSDQEDGAFTPTWTGTVLVQVQNMGSTKSNTNAYSLVLSWADWVRCPFTFVRQLAAKGSDSFKLAYEAGKGKARVTVRTDGQAALEVAVLDPGGASVATAKAESGYHDGRSLTWQPVVSGTYTVRIRNVSGVGCEYVLTTD
jgi:hypothetical protein